MDSISAALTYPRSTESAFCFLCDKPAKLLTYETSAELFNTDLQDIALLAQQGKIHRIHNRMGDVRICEKSLFECFNDRPTRLLDSHFTIAIEKSFESIATK